MVREKVIDLKDLPGVKTDEEVFNFIKKDYDLKAVSHYVIENGILTIYFYD